MNNQGYKIGIPFDFLTTLEPLEMPTNIKKFVDIVCEKFSVNDESRLLRAKYCGTQTVLGSVIAYMLAKDITFMQSYEEMKGTFSRQLEIQDEIFGIALNDEEARSKLEQMYQKIFEVDVDVNKSEEFKGNFSNVIYVNVPGPYELINFAVAKLGFYGVVEEVLEDEHVKQCISDSFVTPIFGAITESLVGNVEDEEERKEYLDVVGEMLEATRILYVYQALITVVVSEAINRNTNISNVSGSLDHDTLVEEVKKELLKFMDLASYQNEMKDAIKLMLV